MRTFCCFFCHFLQGSKMKCCEWIQERAQVLDTRAQASTGKQPASMQRRPRVMPRRQSHVLDTQAVARYRALQPTVGENLSGHDRHVGRLLAVGRYKV